MIGALHKILIEMKNISELMIDLAYSAVIYNNKEIAEEVMYLGEMVRSLNIQLQRRAIEKAIVEKSVDEPLVVIRMGDVAEDMAEAAIELAYVVLKEIEPHPILKESLKEFDITIVRFRVHESSALVGKSLGSVRLASETGMWVIAIKRGEKWLFGPDESTVINVNDIVIAKGPLEGARKLKKICHTGMDVD